MCFSIIYVYYVYNMYVYIYIYMCVWDENCMRIANKKSAAGHACGQHHFAARDNSRLGAEVIPRIFWTFLDQEWSCYS